MKASILLEGESLDSRIKIATMLMEMDELDKVNSLLTFSIIFFFMLKKIYDNCFKLFYNKG